MGNPDLILSPMASRLRNPRRSLKPTALDLFAGAGGFSLGLRAAGFRSVAATEIDEVAGATWKRNFPDGHVWSGKQGDMRRLDPRVVERKLRELGVDELDLITAGPPCQGFSRIGRGKLDSLAERAGAFLNDRRNVLYKNAIKFLEVLQPKAFIFENVGGMLHLRGTNVAEAVCHAVENTGYVVKCAVLNSAWFGIPQTRERVFIIGLRGDLGIEPMFPAITHRVARQRGNLSTATLSDGTWARDGFFVRYEDLEVSDATRPAITARQALADLPPFRDHLVARQHRIVMHARRELFPPVPYAEGRASNYATSMRGWDGFESNVVTDHFCRWTPRDFATFRRMKHGDRYPEALEHADALWRAARSRASARGATLPPRKAFVPPYSDEGFPDKWRKLDPDLPSWTVTAHLAKDTYSHIHYDSSQARMISPREAARLQSFPDAFQFEGSTGAMFKQIGNAVPPLLAFAVARQVRASLDLAGSARRRSAA